MATFGERLQQLRLDKGLTQAELASYLGVTPKAISFYEHNEREASNKTLNMLATLFDVPIDYLIGRDNTSFDDVEFFRIKNQAKDSGVSPQDLQTALEWIEKFRNNGK